jgi:hypothetical protein
VVGGGSRGGGLRFRVSGIWFLVVLHWSPDLEKLGVGRRRRAGGGVGSVGGGGEARQCGSAAGRAGWTAGGPETGGEGARIGSG